MVKTYAKGVETRCAVAGISWPPSGLVGLRRAIRVIRFCRWLPVPPGCGLLLAEERSTCGSCLPHRQGARGHLFPQIPLAWALLSSGHEILLATAGPRDHHRSRRWPDDYRRRARPRHERVDRRHVPQRRCAREGLPRELVIALFAKASREMLDGTRSCVDIWSPDVVIYESMHGAGAVVAAERGIPLSSMPPPGHPHPGRWCPLCGRPWQAQHPMCHRSPRSVSHPRVWPLFRILAGRCAPCPTPEVPSSPRTCSCRPNNVEQVARLACLRW
jgi:hypothetical protein